MKCYSALFPMFTTFPQAVCVDFSRSTKSYFIFASSARVGRGICRRLDSPVVSAESPVLLEHLLFTKRPNQCGHPSTWIRSEPRGRGLVSWAAVSFSRLSHTTNQRRDVLRPSVATGCFDRARDLLCSGGETSWPGPSPEKQNQWCSKLVPTAYKTISYGNEYCKSFFFPPFVPCSRSGLPAAARGTRVSRSLRGGRRSLAPVYS